MTDDIFTVVKLAGAGESMKHVPDKHIDGKDHNTAAVLRILSRYILEYHRTVGNMHIHMSIEEREHENIKAPVLMLTPIEYTPVALTLVVTCMAVEDSTGKLEQLLADMQTYCSVPDDAEAGIHRYH